MILLETVSFFFLLLLSFLIPLTQAAYRLPAASVEGIFYVLMFFCGAYTGAEFPVASSVYVREAGSLGRGTGVMDAFDHGGALIGAFLTGVLIIPLAGIIVTILLLATVKFFVVLFWLYSSRRAGIVG